MLSNACFLAKFRFDTAENEPAKNLQKFARIGRTLGGQGRRHRRGDPHAADAVRERAGHRLPAAGQVRRTRRVVASFWQIFARFQLYRQRSLQENTRFTALFKIYQIIKLKFLKFGKILQILKHLQNFC